MGNLMIVLVTLITIMILGIRNRRIDKNILKKLKNTIKEINKTYIEIFTQKSILNRIMQGGLILFAGVSSLVNIYTAINLHLHMNLYSQKVEWILKLILIFVSFLIVLYSIGYILHISLRIQGFIHNVEHKNLKVDFILNYSMISTYLTVLLVFPEEYNNNILIGIIGMGVCYYLSIKILITVIANPENVKSIKDEDNGFTRLIFASILILLMLVINLYLIVCLVNGIEQGSFANAKNNFDLFYYTIITFTTIGYGDIIPVTILAKIASIMISITSVVCLSVFLSSVLSYKDELINK